MRTGTVRKYPENSDYYTRSQAKKAQSVIHTQLQHFSDCQLRVWNKLRIKPYKMAFLGQTLLVLSLATLALSQEYLIVPNNQSSCHTNTTCFILDQLAQTDLTNGANLTLIFQPGEHTLTRLLSIHNFKHVQMIGQNTPVLTLHDRGWIELSDINQLSIESLTFIGHTSSTSFVTKRLRISNTCHLLLQSVYFTSLYSATTTSILFISNRGKSLERIKDQGSNACTVSIETCTFRENGGPTIYIDSIGGLVTINSTVFITNNADRNGGAIYVNASDNVSIYHSTFYSNRAWNELGGAIYVNSSSVYVYYSSLIWNVAVSGGGIAVESGALYLYHSTLSNNLAIDSGGILLYSGSAYIYNSSLIGNEGLDKGGAIFVGLSNVVINSSILTGNNTAKTGGGIYVSSGNASIYNSSITDNSAVFVGGIAAYSDSVLYIYNSILRGNTVHEGNDSVIYISQSTLMFFGENTISNNNGSIYAFDSRVHFNGPTVIVGNHAIFGGAIKTAQSTVYVNRELLISNNTAKYGGGVYSRETSLFVNSPVTISQNKAIEGGAIYAYQSTIEFKNAGCGNFTNNVANKSGGGIYAIASIVRVLSSFVCIDSNTAEAFGGGFYLEQNSKIYILKQGPENDSSALKVSLTVSNNKALVGGGVYVNNNQSGGEACSSQTTQENFFWECFIQTLKLYEYYSSNGTVNTFITNNTAARSGSAIYGGLLDRCTVSPYAELRAVNKRKGLAAPNGWEYIRRTVELPADEHSISSDPLQVKLCDGSISNVTARKGQPFLMRIMALDQAGNPINARTHSIVVTKSGVGRLKEGQVEQRVGRECTELEYNVFSEDSSAQLDLHAIGPCANLGISRLTITVTFLNCTCLLGFHQSQSKIECSCECDPELQAAECFPEEETFQPGNGLWVGAETFTDCNDTGYLVHNCPFDYCVDQPVNISLNSSQQIDRQCAYNRSGVLCGECEEGLSLVFGSSKCKECSNIYLLLLIPFAVAGIALVVFILFLNATVATGSIYGLIFYANVLAANKAIFLPFKAPNFLTVFVSWVNLDLGIETCFYDGMNSQAKVLLQLAFPAYLFLLMFLIIVLSKYVNSFTKLLSNRNPVAALCTLLILSYSKLLRLIIAALQFTFLDCSDNSILVWLYDGNVQYFSQSHIPRFVAAAVILTACVLFTTLLFFGQWFPHCSNWKIMKWTNNTKYIGFMDAFHAPFTPKHRYWPGLLLFSLIAHNLAASMAPDTSVPVLSAGCIAVGLNAYKLAMNRVYKNRLNTALETLFLLNVGILAYGNYHVKSDSSKQLVLAYISMSIALILFVVITCYHFYKYMIKKTKVWNNQVRPLNTARRINFNIFRRNQLRLNMYDRLVDIDDNIDFELPGYIYTGKHNYEQGPREETDPADKYITPPIIRPATSPDQLREPALDILSPVTEEDYRLGPPMPQPEHCRRSVVTRTLVEITRNKH